MQPQALPTLPTTQRPQTRRTLKLGCVILATALSGCAALEVQVDVYKGPLVNHEDIQLRQLTSIAMSAQVLMTTMRNRIMETLQVSDPKCLTAGFIDPGVMAGCLEVQASAANSDQDQRRLYAQQLNGVLSLYRQRELIVDDRSIESLYSRGRTVDGIEELASKLADKTACVPRATRQVAGNVDRHECKLKERADRAGLENALVDLAARMNYLAVNLYLIDPASAVVARADDTYGDRPPAPGDFREETQRFKSLLEAIANTILVHADDLKHRSQHEDTQLPQAARDRERQSANAAFAPQEAAFDRLVRAMKAERDTAKEREARSSDRVGQAQAAVEAAKKKLDEINTVVEQQKAAGLKAADAWNGSAALVALLQGGAANCKTAQAGDPVLDKSCEADAKAVATAVANTPTPLSRQALVAAVQEALKPLMSAFDGTPQHPTMLRLAAAGTTLTALASATEAGSQVPQERAKALDDLRKRARLQMDFQRSGLDKALLAAQAAKRQQEADSQAHARAETALARTQAASGATSAQQWTDALAAVLPLRSAVMSELGTASKTDDVDSAKQAINKLLSADAASQPVQKLVATLVPANASVLVSPGVESVTQVLDSVITQLRYQHLAAVRAKGADHEDAKRIEAAVAAAFKQRAGMAYLRPSSAYLRSVFAASEAQTDPGLGWRNLLNDTAVNLGRNAVRGDSGGGIRDTLDKAFWQNINTVRVNAGGDSNFVIAKDDIGNWYVKAMGADPSAMVRTAKNLALYNIGTRLPANLMRIDALRERVDDRNLAPDERSRAETELKDLTGGKSSAAVTGRATTFELFRQNFAEQSLVQLQDLAQKLSSKVFSADILARWQATFKDSGIDTDKTLRPLLEAGDYAKHLDDATTAANPPQDKADPGKAVVEALAALHRARSALRTLVTGLPDLVAEASPGVAQAEGDATAARKARDEAVATLTKASGTATQRRQDLTTAEAAKDSTRIAAAQKAVSDADGEVVKASEALALAQTRLAATETTLAEARARRSATTTRRDRAADDVDQVLRKTINERVAERLRVLGEYETALKVVGKNNQ